MGKEGQFPNFCLVGLTKFRPIFVLRAPPKRPAQKQGGHHDGNSEIAALSRITPIASVLGPSSERGTLQQRDGKKSAQHNQRISGTNSGATSSINSQSSGQRETKRERGREAERDKGTLEHLKQDCCSFVCWIRLVDTDHIRTASKGWTQCALISRIKKHRYRGRSHLSTQQSQSQAEAQSRPQ